MSFLSKLLAFNTQLEATVNNQQQVISRTYQKSILPLIMGFTLVIIIIDRSFSMSSDDYSPSRIKAAINAACEYVRKLVKQNVQAQISVISFSNDSKVVVFPTSTNNFKCIVDGLHSIAIDGCTNIGSGLKEAKKLITKFSGENSQIILLTDGYGDCNVNISDNLKKTYKTTIDVIGIGGSPSEVNEILLRKIATTDPDGTSHYRFIKDAHSLEKHYRQLASGLVWKGNAHGQNKG